MANDIKSVSNQTRDLAAQQLSTNGRYSFEAGRYIAEIGFRAELQRITQELMGDNTVSLQKPNFLQDTLANLGNVQSSFGTDAEEVSVDTPAGAFQLQTYTSELQTSSQAAIGVSQLGLDKQNEILTNLAK
jgi:hypothetical protein